jgi:hypothetical protein
VFIAGLIIGGAAGLWAGVYIGGWRAIVNVSRIAHRDLMSRAGLRKR